MKIGEYPPKYTCIENNGAEYNIYICMFIIAC